MSAPDHAKPIGKDGWKDPDGNEDNELPLEHVECQGCGWEGLFHELLAVDPDEDETMWCPQCRCLAWVWGWTSEDDDDGQ